MQDALALDPRTLSAADRLRLFDQMHTALAEELLTCDVELVFARRRAQADLRAADERVLTFLVG